ncbi:MAG: biotin--[acetyl-CoA-carboxylase] ligase [Chitinophagaceae bacterium]|nr:biotin--[acetyl-CoA-carboxylase] ligase [Chitinophagaceae bacterium]
MFPQTSANHTPTAPFVILSSVESTNNYAMAKLHVGMVDHGFCFLALEQSAGRGQRGKQWLSKPGENITMSSVFAPEMKSPSQLFTFPFLLSASMALGCYDFIKDLGISAVSIKWPNDLYIGDRKAGGILIENNYKGDAWHRSVVGTGVNINQVDFSEAAGKPVSLKMVTGKQYDVVKLGKKLFAHLLKRYETIDGSTMKEYNGLLYRKGEEVRMKKDNIVFTARIDHVSESGELVTAGPVERRFKVGEVEFV